MEKLNGYPFGVIKDNVFDKSALSTPSQIRKRISLFEERLAQTSGPVFISMGENCGPGLKIKQAGLQSLGSNYFDNLVAPIESIIRVIDADFQDIFALSTLSIGVWEGHDSVRNDFYNIFFHHYFHVRGHEKAREQVTSSCRLIDECDISLFLPLVLSQFEYLRAKFRLILRSDKEKCLIIRTIDGSIPNDRLLRQVNSCLDNYGGLNFRVRIVHSVADAEKSLDPAIFRFIPEDNERWGSAEAWKSL